MAFRLNFNIRILAALMLCFSILTLSATAQKSRTRVLVQNDKQQVRFDTVQCVKNAFKLNPLIFLTGEIPVYYERALSPQISFEIALGYTFRNYMSLLYGNEADDFGGGVEILPNPSFHFAVRYYFEPNLELEGLYLSPEFSYRKYSKNIAVKDADGRFTDENNLDERKFNDIKVLIGYQSLSHSSNWLLDFYTGLGVRVRDMQIVEETNHLGNGWSYNIEQVNDIVPAFYIGIKFGLGF